MQKWVAYEHMGEQAHQWCGQKYFSMSLPVCWAEWHLAEQQKGGSIKHMYLMSMCWNLLTKDHMRSEESLNTPSVISL